MQQLAASSDYFAALAHYDKLLRSVQYAAYFVATFRGGVSGAAQRALAKLAACISEVKSVFFFFFFFFCKF